ncbi:hypothetical protein GGX14DRAFT_573717 [Mycena pura]|uniref:Uncharacterized protein n=1 Tax=Mycena pura TaxID=153505 RepID=A0AAD6UYE8_9AGAR|nr:hypothetical protein GGX14DRAFT_573717 [Mycena pura]
MPREELERSVLNAQFDERAKTYSFCAARLDFAGTVLLWALVLETSSSSKLPRHLVNSFAPPSLAPASVSHAQAHALCCISPGHGFSQHDVVLLPRGDLFRGRGVNGYPTGAIPRPTQPALAPAGPTPVNSLLPSAEEWDLRDAQAGALIYQNIMLPGLHGLLPTDTSKEMWDKLQVKFAHTSEALKAQAMEKLRGVKLANGSGLPAHLDKLTMLRGEALLIGAL